MQSYLLQKHFLFTLSTIYLKKIHEPSSRLRLVDNGSFKVAALSYHCATSEWLRSLGHAIPTMFLGKTLEHLLDLSHNLGVRHNNPWDYDGAYYEARTWWWCSRRNIMTTISHTLWRFGKDPNPADIHATFQQRGSNQDLITFPCSLTKPVTQRCEGKFLLRTQPECLLYPLHWSHCWFEFSIVADRVTYFSLYSIHRVLSSSYVVVIAY